MDYQSLGDFDFIEIGMGFSQRLILIFFGREYTGQKWNVQVGGSPSLRVLSRFNIYFHRFVAQTIRAFIVQTCSNQFLDNFRSKR